ncbi:MAG: substrate-binding domain-containing protein [Armatimonadetes bacterium]|nr:substrate-binding domain-containing protein [Armatimonadota bacterium]
MKVLQVSTILLAALLIGCGPTEPSTQASSGGATAPKKEGTAKKSLKIAMIAKSTTNPVFISAQEGAVAAAKELTEKEGVAVSVDILTPPTEDGQVQAQKIAQAVNDGADAILISCSDASKVTGAINDAVAKGVPVMTFDSDAAQSKRFAFYGADDKDAGTRVMDELAAQIGSMGTVAILAGNQNAPNLQARAKAVEDEAKAKYPNIKIVGTFYHAETPQDATAKVQQVMAVNSDINGWAMIGGWPLFARTLLDMDPSKVKIVAVDCLPQQLDYIDKGVAPVLLAQPTYDWGHTSVNIIFRKVVKGEDVPVVNKMDLVRVDKAGLKDWAQKLQKWGFKDVAPKYLQ